MKEVTQEYKERLSRLQKVLIENTSTLSDKLRSEIYSRFNMVRYFLLDSSDEYYYKNAIAYFSSYDCNIYIMDHNYHIAEKNISQKEAERLLATMPNPVTDAVILHEMIHSVSCKKGLIFNEIKNGYHVIKENVSLNRFTKMLFNENKALNEGATEFYAQSFLKQETPNYIFFTQIYRILSDVCGYENLKEAYFSADIQKFKDEVKKSFHLKDDTLTEKLLRQMDIVFTASSKTKTIFNHIPLIKNCFETLTKMQVNKIREEVKHTSKTDKEFAENFKKEFDNFDIYNFIMKDACFVSRIWLSEISNQIEKNKKVLLTDYIKQKHSQQLLRNVTVDIVDSIKCKDASKLLYFKEKLGDDKLEVLRLLNQPITIKHVGNRCDNSIAIADYLKLISDKNRKIDFKDFRQEDKFEFMSIVLFSPYEILENSYQYFYLKDIQDYLNNQESTYTRFLDDLDAMEYIEPIIPNLNDSIKSDQNFMMQYRLVKNDKKMNDLDL